MKKKIVVLCGGRGSEREVSLMSGRNVFDALSRDKNHPVLVEIGNDGGWTIVDEIALSAITPPRNDTDVVKLLSSIDIVFVALHGKGGEDGEIQSYLDRLNIKYTCSGTSASKTAFNKYKTSKIAEGCGIQSPKTLLIKKGSVIDYGMIKYPCVVKPNRSGSSVATAIVNNKNNIKRAIREAFKEDSQVLVQKYIKGRELTCPVLGKTGKKLSTLPVLEITSNNEFFDYDAKYKSSKTIESVPTDIESKIIRTIEKQSKRIHRKLDCSGLTRSDFILSGDNEFYFLEINTIPGLSKMSLCPKSAKSAGIGFGELLDAIIFHS